MKISLNAILFLFIFLNICIVPTAGNSNNESIISQNDQIIKMVHDRGGLIFAALPYWGKETTRLDLKKLADHIGNVISTEVVLIILKDSEMLKSRTLAEEIDIGLYNPTIYIETKDIYPDLNYIASSVYKQTNRYFYYSYLISKKGSGLTTIQSLSGKSFAFGTNESTSGYIYPRAWMKENNLDPNKYFSSVQILDFHTDVSNAVLSGKIDAGTISSIILEKIEETPGKLFNRIRKFGPIPPHAIAVTGKMSDKMVNILQEKITSLPSSITDVKDYIFTDFIILTDESYDQMRQIIQITDECKND